MPRGYHLLGFYREREREREAERLRRMRQALQEANKGPSPPAQRDGQAILAELLRGTPLEHKLKEQQEKELEEQRRQERLWSSQQSTSNEVVWWQRRDQEDGDGDTPMMPLSPSTTPPSPQQPSGPREPLSPILPVRRAEHAANRRPPDHGESSSTPKLKYQRFSQSQVRREQHDEQPPRQQPRAQSQQFARWQPQAVGVRARSPPPRPPPRSSQGKRVPMEVLGIEDDDKDDFLASSSQDSEAWASQAAGSRSLRPRAFRPNYKLTAQRGRPRAFVAVTSRLNIKNESGEPLLVDLTIDENTDCQINGADPKSASWAAPEQRGRRQQQSKANTTSKQAREGVQRAEQEDQVPRRRSQRVSSATSAHGRPSQGISGNTAKLVAKTSPVPGPKRRGRPKGSVNSQPKGKAKIATAAASKEEAKVEEWTARRRELIQRITRFFNERPKSGPPAVASEPVPTLALEAPAAVQAPPVVASASAQGVQRQDCATQTETVLILPYSAPQSEVIEHTRALSSLVNVNKVVIINCLDSEQQAK